MRVAGKLALAVILIMLGIFAIRAYQGAMRQMAEAEETVREHHFIIGRALRPAIKEIWRAEGPERALEVLAFANERIRRARQVEIHWVSFQPQLPASYRSRFSAGDLARFDADDESTLTITLEQRLYTYMPLAVAGRTEGALEISELLSTYQDVARAQVRDLLVRSGLAALGSIAAVSVLGFMVVGRPMRRLVDKARRIGAGDLDRPLDIRQRDEIGELAREMNEMCERLRRAQVHLQQETAARIVALEQLRHADRLTTVGTLASGIAHELGTPLNVVSGRAQMIARGEASGAEASESARIIVEQVERITRIIRQLLDFARRRAPERGHHALKPLAVQTLTLLGPMAGKRGITFEPPRTDAIADVDPAQVQQALTNLVVNAIQAMPRGGRVTVEISTGPATPPADHGGAVGNYVALSVTDEGVGIAPHLLPRLFEPFFTTKEVGEGTGLGLSVAYGIARDHHGWIAVESTVGQGSRFTLYLPASRGEGRLP